MAEVIAVARDGGHRFTKPAVGTIRLLAGLGVEGDAHLGVTVQHRSRIALDPTKPNLRQVHLIHKELLDELNGSGFAVYPGAMGENITTAGIDLLGLPTGALLRIGTEAVVTVRGLRNPCKQLDDFQEGLMSAVLGRDAEGKLIRRAGIMGTVLESGDICPGDEIRIEFPDGVPQPLRPV